MFFFRQNYISLCSTNFIEIAGLVTTKLDELIGNVPLSQNRDTVYDGDESTPKPQVASSSSSGAAAGYKKTPEIPAAKWKKLALEMLDTCIDMALVDKQDIQYIAIGNPCNQFMVERIKGLNGKTYCQLDINLLQGLVGAYILDIFNPSPLAPITETVQKIIEQGLIEHLEILILTKVFEINFLLINPAYDNPMVFCNSIDKQKTICLMYDVQQGQRAYYFINSATNLLKSIQGKQEIFFQLPSTSDLWFMLLQQKYSKLPSDDPRLSQQSTTCKKISPPTITMLGSKGVPTQAAAAAAPKSQFYPSPK